VKTSNLIPSYQIPTLGQILLHRAHEAGSAAQRRHGWWRFPDVVVGALCDCLIRTLVPVVAAAPIVGEKRFFSAHLLAYAAFYYVRCIALFRTLQMAYPAPQKRKGYFQLSQAWPNFWQLQHCGILVWILLPLP
jgi:hypothetical protein